MASAKMPTSNPPPTHPSTPPIHSTHPLHHSAYSTHPSVVGISDIIVNPGLINVDFSDVRSVMSNAGTALMGIGSGNGPDRARLAAQRAVASPLLECDLVAATGAVFNIVGGPDMTLGEITAASEIIEAAMDPEANIIFGSLVDESRQPGGDITVTMIATGFDAKVRS